MRKFIYTLFLTFTALFAGAQGFQSVRIGLVGNGEECLLSYPTTTISVELLLEEEKVIPGVYARYAQKYLALRAPLVAQTTYSVVGAAISAVDKIEPTILTPKAPETFYTSLPVDQLSSNVLTEESAARQAADAIFTIRRQRRDIINGEAGEGYFGAGLNDAMDRMDKLEKEYLELFLGSRTVSQTVEKYTLAPQEGTTRYVIARFDPKSGTMSPSELSGTPIYLELVPQDIPDTAELAPYEKSTQRVWFRIAAPTQCTLFNDSQAITTVSLQIYELGKSVEIDPDVNSRRIVEKKISTRVGHR